MNRDIVVATYSPHKMGFVLVDKNIVFLGNFHDFHIGCCGSVIAGYNLKNTWTGGLSLGKVLQEHMEKDGYIVSYSKKELTEKEYKALGKF